MTSIASDPDTFTVTIPPSGGFGRGDVTFLIPAGVYSSCYVIVSGTVMSSYEVEASVALIGVNGGGAYFYMPGAIGDYTHTSQPSNEMAAINAAAGSGVPLQSYLQDDGPPDTVDEVSSFTLVLIGGSSSGSSSSGSGSSGSGQSSGSGGGSGGPAGGCPCIGCDPACLSPFRLKQWLISSLTCQYSSGNLGNQPMATGNNQQGPQTGMYPDYGGTMIMVGQLADISNGNPSCSSCGQNANSTCSVSGAPPHFGI